MKLNAGQRATVDAIVGGKNVFITGEGGTGKSVVVREAVRALKASKKKIVVCAPTGIAAQQIKGVTIHSAFRFSLEPKVADALEGIRPSRVIEAADVIIIDEIGMVRRDLMDAIAAVVQKESERRARDRDREMEKAPLQVVLVGDFSQLPPVVTGKDREALEAAYGAGASMHAFAAGGWKSLNLETHMLSEVMRQKDPVFTAMLNRARVGDVTCIAYLNNLAREDAPSDAVALVGTNRAADAANRARMQEIEGKSETFTGSVTGTFKDADMAVPRQLELKAGARVIIVSNDQDAGYVNGSTGVVTKLHARDSMERNCVGVRLDSGRDVLVHEATWDNTRYAVKEMNGQKLLHQETTGQYRQFPIRLGWALTYHKAQGQTINHVIIDPSVFAPGQLYVGLSRATAAAGIWLTRPIRPRDLQADASVVAFYRELGWMAPEPATGDERPLLPVADSSEKDVMAEAGGTETPLPTSMDEIMAELTSLLSAGGRAWARVYALMARVADNELFRPSFRSYSAWLRALAAQTGVSQSLLWHRKSAGDFYEEWRDEHPGAPELSDSRTAGLSEENLNLARKISKAAPERIDELMASIMAGSTGTKDLRATWREVRQEARREATEREQEGQEQGQDVPSPVVVTDETTMTVTASDAATWAAVLAALRGAGLL